MLGNRWEGKAKHKQKDLNNQTNIFMHFFPDYSSSLVFYFWNALICVNWTYQWYLLFFCALFFKNEGYFPVELFIFTVLGSHHHKNKDPTNAKTLLPHNCTQHPLKLINSMFHLSQLIMWLHHAQMPSPVSCVVFIEMAQIPSMLSLLQDKNRKANCEENTLETIFTIYYSKQNQVAFNNSGVSLCPISLFWK